MRLHEKRRHVIVKTSNKCYLGQRKGSKTKQVGIVETWLDHARMHLAKAHITFHQRRAHLRMQHYMRLSMWLSLATRMLETTRPPQSLDAGYCGSRRGRYSYQRYTQRNVC
jgi:hypothetical protein